MPHLVYNPLILRPMSPVASVRKLIAKGIMILLAAALLLFTTSCKQSILRMQVDNLSRESLASYHIGTPDPRLLYPPLGQRIIVSWYLPQEAFCTQKVSIKISLIYGNHTQETLWYTPKHASGLYVRALLNDEYFKKCGIITYKADLYFSEQLVKCWKHHLWTELITFEPPTSDKDETASIKEEAASKDGTATEEL